MPPADAGDRGDLTLQDGAKGAFYTLVPIRPRRRGVVNADP
jgi:hypothetical protein